MKFTKKEINEISLRLKNHLISKEEIYNYWLPEIEKEIKKVEAFNTMIFWNEQIFENITLEIEEQLAKNTSKFLGDLNELYYDFKQHLLK